MDGGKGGNRQGMRMGGHPAAPSTTGSILGTPGTPRVVWVGVWGVTRVLPTPSPTLWLTQGAAVTPRS